MRRILTPLLACLITLPALAADSVRFYDPCWASATGQDGKGGVSLVSRGDTVKFVIDKAPCPIKIDRDVLNDSSIADYVADVRAVIAEMPSPPVLIGHSMGGFIVQKLLEREMPAGAVLMASVPPRGLAGPGLSLAVWNPAAAFGMGSIQSLGQNWAAPDVMQEALFSNAVGAAQALGYLARMGPESTRAMFDMYSGEMPDPGRRAACPILVVGAAEDALIPDTFVRATARSFDAPHRVFDGIGHLMMLDAGWEEVAEHLDEWLERTCL